MATSFSEARSDRKRRKRLAELQAVLSGLGLLGQGMKDFAKAKTDKRRLDLEERRTAAFEEQVKKQGMAGAEPGVGDRESLMLLEDLRKQYGFTTPEEGRRAIQQQKQQELDAAMARMLEMFPGREATDPAIQAQIMQMQERLEDRWRRAEAALTTSPGFAQRLFGGVPAPEQPQDTPAGGQDLFQTSPLFGAPPLRGGQPASGQTPGVRPPGGGSDALQSRAMLPGQMPGERPDDMLAGMPQGGMATAADRNFLGEFGRLWRTVMDRRAPVQEQIAAWTKLQDYRVQPPYWVSQQLQGPGGSFA